MQAMTDQLSSSDWEKRRNTHTCQSFYYNQRCNGKLKLYYLDNAWIPLLESNCLGKRNIFFKKPYHVPCASWRRLWSLIPALHIRSLTYESCKCVTISYHMLSYVGTIRVWTIKHSLEMTIEDMLQWQYLSTWFSLLSVKLKKKKIFDIFKGKILKALLAFEVFFFKFLFFLLVVEESEKSLKSEREESRFLSF